MLAGFLSLQVMVPTEGTSALRLALAPRWAVGWWSRPGMVATLLAGLPSWVVMLLMSLGVR